MKKILLVLVLMFSAGVIVNAQFKFGAKAAVDFASTNGEDSKTGIGFAAGFFGQIKFGDRWALQPELLFNMQRPKEDLSHFDATISLGYVTIPVMVQFYIIEGLFVEAGPQVGILATFGASGEGGGYEINDKVVKKDRYETVVAALNLGVGYDLQNVPIGFFFRSSLGMSPQIKKDEARYLWGYTDDIMSRSFQLGMLVKF